MIKAKKTLREDYTTTRFCDLCKEKIVHEMYERNEAHLWAAIGPNYPESDSSTTYELDCCGDCFLQKIMPLIESNLNVKFLERDSSNYKAGYQRE